MASETVKKILEAEAEANRRNSEAIKRRDEAVEEASRRASHAVQKKLGEAAKESGKLRSEYEKKLKLYAESADAACSDKLMETRSAAEKNMDKAVDAIIANYF